MSAARSKKRLMSGSLSSPIPPLSLKSKHRGKSAGDDISKLGVASQDSGENMQSSKEQHLSSPMFGRDFVLDA